MKQKLARLLSGIEIGLFDTAHEWGENTDAPYYKHFNDEDLEIRAHSILAFTAMLGNCLKGPADVFHTNKNPNVTYYPEEPYYRIDDYLPAFLEQASDIKQHFPILYIYTVGYLFELDHKEPFEQVFLALNPELFKQMRLQLFTEENIKTINSITFPTFNQLLREMGLPTFFAD